MSSVDQAIMFLGAIRDRIDHLMTDLAALRGEPLIKKNGPYTPSQMLDAIGVKGKAKKDILAGKDPRDKNKKKRKYTKRADYWKNPVKKHKK